MDSPIFLQSQRDLTADIAWLEYLTATLITKLKRNNIRKTNRLEQRLSECLEAIQDTRDDLAVSRSTEDLFPIYLNHQELYRNIREMTLQAAAEIVAVDYESPAFAASRDQQSGRFPKEIYQSVNDYTRDQHYEGRWYEQAFKKAFIPLTLQLAVAVFATSSGMAALTTIIGFLQGEKLLRGPVFVGKSSYFENKKVLEAFLPTGFEEVDETQTDLLLSKIRTIKPSTIFLDSLCNAQNLAFPNIPVIMKEIAQESPQTILVLDNTCLAAGYQPMSHMPIFGKRVRIIVWESLIKHYQYGLDRVTGGIIYARCKNALKLYDYRDHLGTNISDIAAAALPPPNHYVLKSRLLRHEQNAHTIAERLRTHSEQHISHLKACIYPSHNSETNTEATFPGAILTLIFEKKYDNVRYYKKILSEILSQGRTLNIPLQGGTSFGFPQTRIYIPASRPGQGTPFFRIAVGMEPAFITEKIITCIENALSK